MPSIAAIDRHVEQLFEVLGRLAKAFAAAGIEYRVVGGMAVFLHVEERDPLAARLTRDIDVAVDRRDLERIVEAVRLFGFEHRHAAGVRYGRGCQAAEGSERGSPRIRSREGPA